MNESVHGVVETMDIGDEEGTTITIEPVEVPGVTPVPAPADPVEVPEKVPAA